MRPHMLGVTIVATEHTSHLTTEAHQTAYVPTTGHTEEIIIPTQEFVAQEVTIDGRIFLT